jgi:hypothetical protein
MVRARDALLDPSRRFPHELRYPIDSSLDEVEALYAMLSSDHASLNSEFRFALLPQAQKRPAVTLSLATEITRPVIRP